MGNILFWVLEVETDLTMFHFIKMLFWSENNILKEELDFITEIRFTCKPYKVVKGKVHPEIKLVLIGVEKWEKQVSESLSKFWLKIRKLGFLSCDQSNTNWQLYDVKCELNFHLLSTKKI